MKDVRQSPEYARYMEKIGWSVEEIPGQNSPVSVFVRRVPLLGSVMKIQRPHSTIPFPEIDKLAKKHKAVFVKLELADPSSVPLAQASDYKQDHWPLLPTRTIRIDLHLPLTNILGQMRKDARYELRKIDNKNMQLMEMEDLGQFRRVWRHSAKKERWIPPQKDLQSLKNAFGKQALFLAVLSENVHLQRPSDKDILAGATVLISDKTAYYYFAFCSNEGRRLSAPCFLVWEIIKLAKKKGCQVFDFEGIEDPRFKETKSWKGFTHFKRSFGGQEVEYPEPLIKFYNPIVKFFFNFKS